MEIFFDPNNPIFVVGVVAVSIWALIWTGFALWRAARLSHKKWFVVLLVLNTAGILEILYLFVFSKPKPKEEPFTPVESSPGV